MVTCKYTVGDEVLVVQNDNRIFLGTVARLDLIQRRVFISYRDGSSGWADCSAVSPFNEVKKNGEVGQDERKASAQPLRHAVGAEAPRERREQRKTPVPEFKFSYDIRLLHWNDFTTTNAEKKYCYCGRPGK
jgi:hypothetical protein